MQDYVVVPNQYWLDGIATEAGMVRQFVAMPVGGEYNVEKQVTGVEVTGGLQIEVTPADLFIPLTVEGVGGSTVILVVDPRITVRELRALLEKQDGLEFDHLHHMLCDGGLIEG